MGDIQIIWLPFEGKEQKLIVTQSLYLIKNIHTNGLPMNMSMKRSKKYLKGGNGALVGIEVKGGVEAGKKFIESLKMFYHVANIGDARSLAIHPATTTHSQLSDEDMLATGVSPSYVRLSIGIEHIDDIISDLSNALDNA